MRGDSESEKVRLADLRVFLLAVLRLNDGKHFKPGACPEKRDRQYGSINDDGHLEFYQDECKVIKKVFEPLYSNHLQFKGKVLQEQKAMKVLEAEIEAR